MFDAVSPFEINRVSFSKTQSNVVQFLFTGLIAVGVIPCIKLLTSWIRFFWLLWWVRAMKKAKA